MLITLNPQLTFHVFKEGIAFFNRFTGDTFFIPVIFAPAIAKLKESSCTVNELIETLSSEYSSDSSLTPEDIQQFIAEAKKSDIVTASQVQP